MSCRDCDRRYPNDGVALRLPGRLFATLLLTGARFATSGTAAEPAAEYRLTAVEVSAERVRRAKFERVTPTATSHASVLIFSKAR